MINTLTLNPAMDHNLRLVSVEKGITNRVYDTFDTVGGKGTHVSMNLSQMGLENRAFGICRGKTGAAIVAALKELGVTTCFVERTEQESRTVYILIEDNNICTTIAEKGPELTEADIRDLYAKMLEHIQPGDTLVLSGDASNCGNPRIYNEIAALLKPRGVRIILDASGESLRNGLECSPYLIKPNEDELEMLCGFPMKTDEDVIRGIVSLNDYGIEVIAVSLGKRGSVVRFGKDCYRVHAPVVNAINTAGCGDCFLSGLLYGMEKGLSHEETLRFACATSAATAASSLSVGYDDELAQSLMDQVKIERII